MMSDEQRDAAELWFRRRGLPLVIDRSAQASRLLQRSVPAQVVLIVLTVLVVFVEIRIALDGGPDEPLDAALPAGILVLAVVVAVLALAVLAGLPITAGWWTGKAMDRLSNRSQLAVGGGVAVVSVFGVPALASAMGVYPYWLGVLTAAAELVVLILLVRIGAGSIVLWAARKSLRQLGSIGTMASRALPLLLLVVMFSFFTGELWQAANGLSRAQLWIVVGFLSLVAIAFIVATFSDELPALRGTAVPDAALRDTPLAGEAPTGERAPLSRAEHVNVVLVLVLAQAVQIVAFSVLVFVFFVVFGTLMVTPAVQATYLGSEPLTPGTLFGVPLPMSNALIQVSVFLAAFAGLYFTASTTTDERYRRAFFQPLLDEVAIGLAARDVYRARRR
ncbi:hypothetical protein [Pseudonocardia sp. GCM10023141]|uniref:hypothetical protein n=1 Tax=Pseudonocardia sp. GCM10023141 TaxID=3252653 RepID=UPI003610A6AF